MTSQLLTDTGRQLRAHPPAARPPVDELRRRTARRTRRRASVGAVAVVTVGIGGIATIAGHDRANTPAVGDAPAAVATVGDTTVPPEFGWPPRMLIDGWDITYFNQNGLGEDGTVGGDLTFTSTRPATVDASTPTLAATSTNLSTIPPTVAPNAGTAAAAQIQMMWSSEDRADAWSNGSQPDGSQPDTWQPLTVAGRPAVAIPTESPLWVVIVDVPEGSIELRIPAADRADVDAVVGSIHAVDQATFDAALPDSVVTPDEHAAVVAEMLDGVPVPDDFDPTAAAADSADIYRDRVALATAVASDVACAWLDDWFTVWENEDATELDTILAALESAPSWPLLQGITVQQSGLSTALGDLVATLRDGGSLSSGAGPAPISRDGVANLLGCEWPTTQ